MGMAVDHLLAKLVHHVSDVVASFLLGNFGVENYMKEHVSEFFFQSRLILLHHCITKFIDLLDRHRP